MSDRLQISQNILCKHKAFEYWLLCNIKELIVSHWNDVTEKIRLIKVDDIDSSKIFEKLLLKVI